MSSPAYRGRHRPPAGRHRAARPTRTPTRDAASTTSLPRFAGSGYLLPTAAAATLVLTATGAHLGSAAAPPATAASLTGLTASGTATEDAIERDVMERAARDDDRSSALSGTDAVPAGEDETENAASAQARAQADAAAAADEKAATDAAADADAAQAQAQADAEAQQKEQAKAAAHSWVPFIGGGYQLTSGFGMRWGSMHPGQDFAVPVGTQVKSMSSGTVAFAGWQGGYGYKVEIQYWDGTVSWFCHNSKLLVKRGENVVPGEVVSLSGSTGHSTGPHVHVEIHPNDGSAVSPLPWLKKMGAMP